MTTQADNKTIEVPAAPISADEANGSPISSRPRPDGLGQPRPHDGRA
jgi:hypothetical protein